MNKFDYKNLTPFKWFVLENFPFIEADFDSLTNWQLYCKLGNEMNKIINSTNTLGTQVETVTTAFNELKTFVDDYFKNLDVQEEINKKLDLLVSDGTLQNLLNNIFDNLNDKINTLDDKISSVASGSPAKVYSTVQDLENDNPDHTKIYLVSSDGKWYFWDNDSWVSGGVYQSTGFADNSIDSNSIISVDYDKVHARKINITNNDVVVWGNAGTKIVNPDGSITLNKTTTESGGFQINIPTSLCKANTDLTIEFDIVSFGGKKITIFKNYQNLQPQPLRQGIIGHNKFTIKKENNTGTGANVQEVLIIYETADALTINNIKVYSGEQIENFEDENLKYILDNYLSKQNYSKYVDFFAYELTKPNDSYHAWKDPTTFLVSETGVKFLKEDGDNNSGIEFFNRTDLNGTLNILFDCIIPNGKSLTIYIVNPAVTSFYYIKTFTNSGSYNLQIDLSNLVVYQNLTAPYSIIFAGVSNEEPFEINNIKMFVSDIYSNDLYDKNIENTFKNIFNAIHTETLANQVVLTSPNGTKYQLFVTDTGTLYTTGASIKKALYIGNSLLLGFGTHGMASYDTTDDYYAYLNDYLKTKDANFSASRISGTTIETATSTTTANNYVDNTIMPMMTSDTDLVIIQLGDNTANDETAMSLYETNITYLINKLRSINSNVKILLVGVWYNANKMIPIMTETAKKNNVILVNISSLSISANQNKVGAKYVASDGSIKTIDNPGIASHPSSIGMKAIADKLSQYI